MQALQESQEEFCKRSRLVYHGTGIHVWPLLDLITEYAVSRYQLFQEAMLYRHHHRNNLSASAEHQSLLKELTMLAESHTVVKQFLKHLEPVAIEFQPATRLSSALKLSSVAIYCNRVTCYYYVGNCDCTRTLYSDEVPYRIDYF